MSTGEILFLVLVFFAFGAFALTLAYYTSQKIEPKSETPPKPVAQKLSKQFKPFEPKVFAGERVREHA